MIVINEIHVQDLVTESNLAVLIKELQLIMKQLLLGLVGCNKVTIFQEYFSPFYELLMSLFSIKVFMVHVLAGEDDDCNPYCDKDEDSDIELLDDDFIPHLKNYSSDNSDDDSIPPLIFDSSDDSDDDDDDDDDDDSSWPDNSDLSDLPRLASCDESDTESDSEFDVDLNDDDDDDDDSYCSGMWLIIA